MVPCPPPGYFVLVDKIPQLRYLVSRGQDTVFNIFSPSYILYLLVFVIFFFFFFFFFLSTFVLNVLYLLILVYKSYQYEYITSHINCCHQMLTNFRGLIVHLKKIKVQVYTILLPDRKTKRKRYEKFLRRDMGRDLLDTTTASCCPHYHHTAFG